MPQTKKDPRAAEHEILCEDNCRVKKKERLPVPFLLNMIYSVYVSNVSPSLQRSLES